MTTRESPLQSVQWFDERPCRLGEGPLWHPQRQQLFWFDILNNRLLSRFGQQRFEWVFDQAVSAAAWVNEGRLLVAAEHSLLLLDIDSGEYQSLLPFPTTGTATRSNDGRADPWGGFWISTMGWQEEEGAGAIYRYYRGELQCIEDQLTIPNAICFAPGGTCAYWADTPTGIIWQQPLEPQHGWPIGPKRPLIDFSGTNIHPDGAVVDNDGFIWNAQWGSGRVCRYTPKGQLSQSLRFPASQTTCPAFGGPGMKTLFVTSAARDVEKTETHAGCVFKVAVGVRGQAESRVLLPAQSTGDAPVRQARIQVTHHAVDQPGH